MNLSHIQWIARLDHEMINARLDRLTASLRQVEQHMKETFHDDHENDWIRLLRVYERAITTAGERHAAEHPPATRSVNGDGR